MAYSSIGHMGFALIGLAAGTPEGIQGVLVYMSMYLAMTVGTFAVILSMRRGEGMVEQISDLPGPRPQQSGAGVFPGAAAVLAGRYPAPRRLLCGSIIVFLGAIKAGLYALAVIGVLTSVIGAYYYLLIVKVMYFDEPAPNFRLVPGELQGRARHRRPVQSCFTSSIPHR